MFYYRYLKLKNTIIDVKLIQNMLFDTSSNFNSRDALRHRSKFCDVIVIVPSYAKLIIASKASEAQSKLSSVTLFFKLRPSVSDDLFLVYILRVKSN